MFPGGIADVTVWLLGWDLFSLAHRDFLGAASGWFVVRNGITPFIVSSQGCGMANELEMVHPVGWCLLKFFVVELV
jgi:hypothetical protein